MQYGFFIHVPFFVTGMVGHRPYAFSNEDMFSWFLGRLALFQLRPERSGPE